MIRSPSLTKIASNVLVNLESQSRIKNLDCATWSSRSMSRLRACWATQSAVGCAVTPRMCTRRLACSTTAKQYSLVRSTVSQWKKSHAKIPLAWARRNSAQVGPERRGDGSIPARVRIAQTVEAPTLWPMLASSPPMRRYPQSGFSPARRRISLRSGGDVGGPGLLALGGPSSCDHVGVPTQERAGGDEQMSATGRGQESGQRTDQGTVCPGRARTGDLPTQDAHVVAQHQNLCGLGRLRSREERNPGAELTKDQVHEPQRHRR